MPVELPLHERVVVLGVPLIVDIAVLRLQLDVFVLAIGVILVLVLDVVLDVALVAATVVALVVCAVVALWAAFVMSMAWVSEGIETGRDTACFLCGWIGEGGGKQERYEEEEDG
jgi:hypothetical protein